MINGLKFKTRETVTTTSPRSTHDLTARTLQRSQDDVNCEDVKQHGLGLTLTLSHALMTKVLRILIRSFKNLQKVTNMHTSL